jgi:uncharacterized protein DUF4387
MTALGDLAVILRSKNAGIGYLTLDILFDERSAYEAAKAALTPETVAKAYRLAPAELSDFVCFDEGFAIKATLPRPHISGGDGLGEMDLYGSGHYAPLLEIDVPYPPQRGLDRS